MLRSSKIKRAELVESLTGGQLSEELVRRLAEEALEPWSPPDKTQQEKLQEMKEQETSPDVMFRKRRERIKLEDEKIRELFEKKNIDGGFERR